jgi:hypothetical protein
MSDLAQGIYPKEKRPGAPDFVIGKVSINLPQFAEWLRGWKADNPGEQWLNPDLLVGKSGKAYAKVDDWKPEGKESPKEEDIPF